jgi:glutaredoxin 3
MFLVVFSKSYCPYCKSSKALLTGIGAPYFVLELDQIGTYSVKREPDLQKKNNANDVSFGIIDDGAAIQDALEEITNQRSVPNIFINKKHIGGNSDLQARKAELPTLLKEAGAL